MAELEFLNMKIKIKNSEYAFTLLEMSITILIIGILTIAGINFQVNLINSSHTNITASKLKEIEKAIKIFAIKNGYLPCPSNINCKIGDTCARTGVCTLTTTQGLYSNGGISYLYGGIPTASLNLSDNYAIDAWNSRIVYVVNKNYTNKNYFIKTGEKGITVKNTNDDLITDDAVYILISPGENKNGAFNAKGAALSTDTSLDDYENSFNSRSNNIFIKDVLSDNFDDIALYKERKALISDLSLEDIPCNLSELSDLDDDWNYTSHSKCPNGICQQTTEIESKNKCAVGYISKNPYSYDGYYKPVRKCLKYGKWSDVMYPCIEGCGESNINSVVGGSLSQNGQLLSAIDTKYLRAALGERITMECVNNDYKGYVILECQYDGTWEFISGDCVNQDYI